MFLFRWFVARYFIGYDFILGFYTQHYAESGCLEDLVHWSLRTVITVQWLFPPLPWKNSLWQLVEQCMNDDLLTSLNWDCPFWYWHFSSHDRTVLPYSRWVNLRLRWTISRWIAVGKSWSRIPACSLCCSRILASPASKWKKSTTFRNQSASLKKSMDLYFSSRFVDKAFLKRENASPLCFNSLCWNQPFVNNPTLCIFWIYSIVVYLCLSFPRSGLKSDVRDGKRWRSKRKSLSPTILLSTTCSSLIRLMTNRHSTVNDYGLRNWLLVVAISLLCSPFSSVFR